MVATGKYAGSMPPAYGLWWWRRGNMPGACPRRTVCGGGDGISYGRGTPRPPITPSPADILHRALGGIRATYMSPLCIVPICRTGKGEVYLARKNPAPASHCVLFFCPSAFSIALRLCVVVLQPPSTNRRATHASPLRKLFHATVTQRILHRYACCDWTKR
jgi:hypothetical protein